MKILDIISALRKNGIVPRVDGQHLRLSGKVSQLPDDLLQLLREHKQQIIDFLQESRVEGAPESIQALPTAQHYPLSNAQKRIWVLSQFEGGNQAYNICMALHLEGVVEVNQLELAFRKSLERHESLRTTFSVIDEEPVQIVHAQLPFSIQRMDFSGRKNVKQALTEELENLSNFQFDLVNGPLLSIQLIDIAPREHVLIFSMHHIISDGWSIGTWMQEVMASYKNICLGLEQEEPPLDIHYKDFSAWLKNRIDGDFGQRAARFWQQKNLQEVEPLSLPYDFQRPELNRYEGASQKYYFEAEFYANMQALAKKNRSTLFNLYRAVWSLCLHKWSGQNQLIIGTPVAGRSHSQLHNQIGLYVNTLPLLSTYQPAQIFSEYLQELAGDSLESFKYQEYPLDLLIEQLDLARDTSRSPLFDILLVVQNTALGEGAIEWQQQHGFRMQDVDHYLYEEKPTERNKVPSKFDISINFGVEPDQRHFIQFEYRTKLFRKSSIQAFHKTFRHVLDQLMKNDSLPLGQIQIMDSSERQRILEQFNQPIQSHAEKSVMDLLSDNLQQMGQAVAVFSDHQSLSYAQLQERSDAYAHQFAAAQTDRIGIFLHRSAEILAIILAAFKAGKAYVPIDVNYPEERIRYIVEDADLQLLVVDRESREKIPFVASENCLLCESISHTEPFRQQEVDRREETAYLIYTSGSTGRPKGVEITHRNLIAFLKWCHGEFRQTPYELLYAATSYCFDLSVFEMLLPLLQGKRIRILTSALDIPLYLADDRQVMINTVPSVVRHLLEQNISWQHVVALNMAGEPVPKIFKYQLDYQKMEVRNLYGPSEDTTYSSIYRFSDDRLPIIPIGRPVGDTHAYVLDATGQLQPIGVEGEICLSGESVAKGYFGRPDLTAEKFIPNPFHSNLRMYRTGDIGKWLPDGQLAFIGRIDDQVKLRGYRIELGEIQYQLESLPQVKQAVVIVLSLQAEKSIVAYYELESPLAKEKVEKHLSKKLPAYMLPSVLMELERIPLNSNGKVDKKKLPRPDRQSEVAIIGPKNSTQEALVGMWSEVLNREDFGIHHNFFELGGHSLKATRLRHIIDNRMGKNLLLNEIFQYPTIEQQAEILDGKAKQSSAVKIEKAEQSGQAHPLSFAQERLWVLSRFADASKAYHMPAAFEWKGTFNLVLFEEAMKMVIARHESLRTVFREIDNVPMQWIQPVDAIDFALEQVYVEAGESLEDKLTEDWNQPFSLENGPLMRCRLFEQEGRRVLSFNMHHIISDGWSVAVLSQDVLEAYSLLQRRERTSLLPLEIQYKDFATWQRNKLSGAELERQLSYWRDEVFSQGIRPLELPYDFKRPEVKTYEGSTHLHRFSPELTKAIKAQAANFGMSLFMSLMAHVNILMKKLSNQSQITIGTPSSGRDNQQLNRQIGFYVNTLPINSLVDGNASFKDFLQTQRQQILTAFEYQHFPFEMLVEKLQPRRDLSRSPLFDVMLVLQNFDILDQAAAGSSEDLSFERLSLHSGLTKYDLTFSFAEINGSLQLELEYNRQLFKTKSMERMSQQLTRILQTTTRRPDLLLKDISIIDEQEQKLLFSKADQTRVGYRSEETIVSLFQQQVQNQPESPALKMGPTVLTYAQLDQLSGQLAAKLTDEYQLSLEAPVLLHTQRTEWMMVAILGVLKAGGYYVPVDPDYPLSRKQYIFEDCQAVCVLTDHSLPEDIAAWLSQAPVLDVSKLVYDGPTYEAGIRPDQLVYMIYTSGTTGQPKGVQIEHRNVNRLLFNDNDLFDFGPTDRWCLFHSYCFDFSVWEMYGALLKGGQLHMVPRETAQDSRAFFQFLQDEQITVLNQTPTAFRSLNLANKEEFSQTPLSVRCLIFGGEALLPELLTDWHQAYPDCRLVNMYGITETTVHVTYKEITAEEIQLNKSNIGIPIPTLSCYVLDEDLRPVPVGVTGELCVGGAGVARGYHQRPELTAQKFVPNPFREGERMYRSGDFARVLANGDLEYIGRRDEQVKIRGHRIELSEVGTAIAQLPSVEDAVVNIQKNAVGEFELIAYIIPAAEQESNATNHRLALSELLPSYMIPLAFIELEAFPLTPNGKLDQKALAALHQLPDRQSELVPARNEIDQTIIDIWQEVLDRQGIGITDNFFDLGGHSLKATRVASLIQERLGVRIDLKNLFIDPTVEHLSNYVETLQWIDEKSEEEDSQDNEWIL